MKKQILVAAVAALFSITAVNAQGGGGNFQRKTPEERLKPIHDKLDSAFKLDAAKLKQVDEIFLNSFKESDKKMEELRAGGGQMDRDAMMAARQKMTDERNAKLKEVLTADQMKIWIDQIEPTTRPQRGGGNRGGGGGGGK
jgi:CRISPR/Cas system-associated protein Cas10 (large subunit of type III CRISPR-Cas system)